MGIAIHLSDMYWVDRNLKTVFKASKLPGNSTAPVPIRTGLPRLRDIAIFDINTQPNDDSNSCSRFGNGGCDQLCFSFPPSYSINKYLFRCDCATGVIAAGTGTKCDTVSEYLVYATRTEIRSASLDPLSNILPFKPVVSVLIPIRLCRFDFFYYNQTRFQGNLSNVVGLDFDYADNKLFFTQIRPMSQISSISSNAPSYSQIKTIISRRINPEGISYDWTQKKIYWTDSSNNSIYAMNLDGSGVVMIARVDRPRAIVVDPCNG